MFGGPAGSPVVVSLTSALVSLRLFVILSFLMHTYTALHEHTWQRAHLPEGAHSTHSTHPLIYIPSDVPWIPRFEMVIFMSEYTKHDTRRIFHQRHAS